LAGVVVELWRCGTILVESDLMVRWYFKRLARKTTV
jgi:hypothetical protein